jgi:hypothetical protein
VPELECCAHRADTKKLELAHHELKGRLLAWQVTQGDNEIAQALLEIGQDAELLEIHASYDPHANGGWTLSVKDGRTGKDEDLDDTKQHELLVLRSTS